MSEHFRRLERMYNAAPINEYFRPTLHIPEAGVAELRLRIRPDFHHAARAAHGAVYFKALDDATFFAANSLVDDVFVLTVSFNLYLTRPVSEGEVVARGKVVSRSKRLYLAEGVLEDSRGREIARGSGAFMPSTIALADLDEYR
ncbi:MAG TPA: PaaI family thioesterase [Gemmatimonadaceae bacterium]|nr:PaaI family thioesterase [Gemmatimonadaceae bacterium]